MSAHFRVSDSADIEDGLVKDCNLNTPKEI